MKFSELLSGFRDRRGLSKTELARKIHVSPQYIMNIESNFDKAPTFDRVNKIADVLELNELERHELLYAAVEERIPEDARKIMEEVSQVKSVSQSKLSREITDALQDPIAVKALLITHKNSDDIKVAIRHMLDCFPSLSPDKRQAILALCK